MQRYMLMEWQNYQGNKECYYMDEKQLKERGKDCSNLETLSYNYFTSFIAYPLSDTLYKMMKLHTTGKFDIQYERIYAYDVWDQHSPIITPKMVQYPDNELKPQFYVNKKITRKQNRTLNTFFIDQEEP